MSNYEINILTMNQQRIRDKAMQEFEDLTFDFAVKCITLIGLYIVVVAGF